MPSSIWLRDWRPLLLTLIHNWGVYDILRELIALAFYEESLGERRADSDWEIPDVGWLSSLRMPFAQHISFRVHNSATTSCKNMDKINACNLQAAEF